MKSLHILLPLVSFSNACLQAITVQAASANPQPEVIHRQAESRKLKGDEAISLLGKTKVVFYGKVVDQNQMPVPGADVVYTTRKNFFGEESEQRVRTDKNGCFEISDRGLALDLEVSKEGYRKVTSSDKKQGSDGHFEYVEPEKDANHKPVRSRPVVFQLRKIGATETLVRQTNQIIKLSPRGTSGFWSLNSENEDQTKGAHRVELSFMTDCPTGNYVGRPRFDWSFEIKVEDGGLVEQDDVDGFEAPTTGYRASDRVVVKKEDPRWDDSFSERSYYIRFSDGVYARIDLEGVASLDPYGAPVVRASSYLNPKVGSRNLELPLPPTER